MLDEDYDYIFRRFCRHMVEKIMDYDQKIFEADPRSSGILQFMKMEAQLLEICSEYNQSFANKNPELASMPIHTCALHFAKLHANYHAAHAEADLRIRFGLMVQEMTSVEGKGLGSGVNRANAMRWFGNNGTVELFLAYRLSKQLYNFGSSHAANFIAPEERELDANNGHIDSSRETRLILLFFTPEERNQ
ncbi:MAG TPA: hypothetical protein VMD74_03595 [Candidatus Methylomirabilis sp.]|nr:hypothetical protein [Candidatus Methylomirabilis sp.]